MSPKLCSAVNVGDESRGSTIAERLCPSRRFVMTEVRVRGIARLHSALLSRGVQVTSSLAVQGT